MSRLLRQKECMKKSHRAARLCSKYWILLRELSMCRGPLSAWTRPPDNTNGWDSLAHIKSIAALERQFNLRITASEITDLRCLADAEAIVQRSLPACRVPIKATGQLL